jgi:hypothetical protein
VISSARGPILVDMSPRRVDLVAFAVLWAVVLIGAALIAVLGANVVALGVLWLVVLFGGVLLVVFALEDDPDAVQTPATKAVPFAVSAVLTLVYVAAAGVALGTALVAAFVGGAALGGAGLLVLHRRRGPARPMSVSS